jgi:hypothetical protein
LCEAGEAIGPLGRAAAASVIAYLIGALILGRPWMNWEGYLHSQIPGEEALATLVGLEKTELGKARAGVEGAIKHALATSDGSAKCKVVNQGDESLIHFQSLAYLLD